MKKDRLSAVLECQKERKTKGGWCLVAGGCLAPELCHNPHEYANPAAAAQDYSSIQGANAESPNRQHCERDENG